MRAVCCAEHAWTRPVWSTSKRNGMWIFFISAKVTVWKSMVCVTGGEAIMTWATHELRSEKGLPRLGVFY